MPSPIEVLEPEFMRTALVELLLLSVAGGLLGTWIVLRRLAFFTHAVGTATFPGLVTAAAAGVNPRLGAAVVALGYAGGVERAGRGRAQAPDAATGLVLVAALALGVVLASDVFGSGASVDRLLFGSLFGLSASDLAISAAAALGALAATLTCGSSWAATAFDPEGASALTPWARRLDALLLVLVALAVVASLAAVGALLVSALFVLPAATVLLWAPRIPALLAGAVALAAGEALVALYLSYWADAPPGPISAVLAASIYAVVALAGQPRRRQADAA